jgi:hypothetical protein
MGLNRPFVELTLEQRKFRIGYHSFKDGLPQPNNRIEAMGWLLARKEQMG